MALVELPTHECLPRVCFEVAFYSIFYPHVEELAHTKKPYMHLLLLYVDVTEFCCFRIKIFIFALSFCSANGIYVGVGTSEGAVGVYISWNLMVSGKVTSYMYNTELVTNYM